MPTMPAIMGSALRLGNFRLGYETVAMATVRATRVRILLAGTDVSVRVAGLTIRDLLNEAPNTATLTIDSPAPTSGQALRITINSDTPRLLFNGTIQTDDLTYEGKPTQLAYPCTAIDDTARLNKRRPFGTWTNISATTIAQSLVTNFAPGFTSTGVAASLPTVTITFDGSTSFMGCLMQLATLIGGYCNAVDGVVYLFLSDATDLPDPIQSGYPFCDEPHITVTSDESQIRDRVYGKGHAEPVPVDVLAGETIVPVADAVMFNAGGGQAMVGTTPDGAQSQKLTYTGIHLGGTGSLIGTGALPSTAPVPAANPGAGLAGGTFQYGYTYVTASGETLPSPLASITIGAAIAGPTVAPGGTLTNLGTGGPYPFASGSGLRYWAYTWVTATGETVPGPTYLISSFGPGGPYYLQMTAIAVGPVGTTARNIYRTAASSAQLKYVGQIANNTATTFDDHIVDGSLGADAPTVGTATAGNQVALTGIAIGASAVTSRKVYRTVVNGSQLKLQQTIADNTTTVGVTDTTADGSLGANVPTSDTSGLTQPNGQVNAGATTLPTASAAPFSSGGGWVQLGGSQTVRYTGISGNTLTGIPVSGTGSIVTTVVYNQQVVAAPALTGVTGMTLAMQKGSPVHIWVERNDVAAQAAAAIRESTTDYTSDGIHEHVIVDARRGEASLIARCDADLALFANPIVTVTYATRDVKTKSGKPVVVNLASPAISETLTIQDVTISQIDVAPGLAPKFIVTASNVRFSLEDLLRQMAGATLAQG
jgi:hypothetical protein